ncbi:hypothetical protein [Oceanirhabdus sp. W0125-5]|uniref:hypothetical protein n=1 Tax=Oceanirhabdus sp. W0125-5 TaxID=2999116 RepID=UPI0022F2AA18|nr:hypothetical protein [Oceanirhabdus sp. W0125-5]WBW98163.1 hypothetical protein OW730_05195 [Oceanirhabdus sp. W0125-5]
MSITKNNEKAKWYKNPIIHFPLWLIFAFKFANHIMKLPDKELYFSLGIFVFVTGIWGIISDMFFLRIPFLGKLIYEKKFVIQSNIILMIIGIIFCVIAITLGGIAIANKFIKDLMNLL